MKLLSHSFCRPSLLSALSVLFLGLSPLVPVSTAFAQGDYRAVSTADVATLKLNHYFTPDQKSHDADFEWSFGAGEFVLRKGMGAIPTDLVARLLTTGSPVDEIRGRWKVETAGKIVLSEITAARREARQEVTFPIYRTAPSVVRLGEPQYVFSVGR